MNRNASPPFKELIMWKSQKGRANKISWKTEYEKCSMSWAYRMRWELQELLWLEQAAFTLWGWLECCKYSVVWEKVIPRKRKCYEPRFARPTDGVHMLWDEASCQMDAQCFRSIGRALHLTDAYCSTKAKTWKAVCLSCFFKSQWPEGHAFCLSFIVTADSGSGAELSTAIIHVIKGVGR